VELVAEDLARLQPEEFLNDSCIDFYIKWVGLAVEAGGGAGAGLRCRAG
jgi:Ulp1 family protease